VICLLLVSFFWFSQAIRLFNHAGFMMTVACLPEIMNGSPISDTEASETESIPKKELNLRTKVSDVRFLTNLLSRGAIFQTLGVRVLSLFSPLISPDALLLPIVSLCVLDIWPVALVFLFRSSGTDDVVPRSSHCHIFARVT
jgi:hypothetical protein